MRAFVLVSFLTGIATVAAAEVKNQQNVSPEYMQSAGSRTFAIDYIGKITAVPEGAKKLRVWFPVPQDSTVQTIRDLRFSLRPKVSFESKYGNRIAYWEMENPNATNELTMQFVCERKVVILDLAKLGVDGTETSAQ